MSGEQVLLNADAKMRKAVEVLKSELATIRTGRAHPGLVEHLMVDYHGTPVPLNQIAGIGVPEARLLVIQPWDKQILPNIEKAILKSDLGLNPRNDGKVIRLSVPPLSEERRHELIKIVRRRVEEGKIAIRNVRRDAIEELRKLEKDKQISQDDHKRTLDQLQKLTDRFIAEQDEIGRAKEKEVMEV